MDHSLLLHFFLFFLASLEFAAGPLAMADRAAVLAFSLGGARRTSASSCGAVALEVGWAMRGAMVAAVVL